MTVRTYVRTYLVETDEHGGGEGEGEEVGQRVPVPELQEHQYSHCTTKEVIEWNRLEQKQK
jgi:hypothetical protein